MADQRVDVVDYDPGWPGLFAEQCSRVADLLEPWLAGPVAHIGSAAGSWMPAKPVIGMVAPVGSLADAAPAVPVLAGAGWLFWLDDPGRHYRLWFLRPSPEARSHHLQVIEGGHPHAIALLA